jgi:hypothetical protein
MTDDLARRVTLLEETVGSLQRQLEREAGRRRRNAQIRLVLLVVVGVAYALLMRAAMTVGLG